MSEKPFSIVFVRSIWLWQVALFMFEISRCPVLSCSYPIFFGGLAVWRFGDLAVCRVGALAYCEFSMRTCFLRSRGLTMFPFC